jgi:hypothetical protein
MKPTEIAVLELGKESKTLTTVEGAFKFLFKKLRSQDSVLSNELLSALKRRFNESCDDVDGVSSDRLHASG